MGFVCQKKFEEGEWILEITEGASAKLAWRQGIWSSTKSNLPSNIFNFTIKYLNNTLPTRKHLLKWNLSQTSNCGFFLLQETLLHVVAGCKMYLDQGRYTWRHNSALNFLATFF